MERVLPAGQVAQDLRARRLVVLEASFASRGWGLGEGSGEGSGPLFVGASAARSPRLPRLPRVSNSVRSS